MAASVWMRCVTAAVKLKCFSPSFTVRRCLLSAAYTDTKVWESREKDPQNLALLANLMDRTYDRNLPVSSLTVSRFVDNITSTEEVDQAEYYLYKFRHSPNCWYLRDWTIHSWVRQCLKYGQREKALHTLQNKVQYGIFPDGFTFNLLIDSYIKDKDYKSACAVVEEVMLQEAFDLRSTQILSFYALGHYLATKPTLAVSGERALGASLLICGLTDRSTIGLSAQVIGNTLLGKVEMQNGIHAVFKAMPLHWAHGYLDRALAVMEEVSAGTGDAALTKDALDLMGDVLADLSSESESSGEDTDEEEKNKQDAVDEDDEAERAKLPLYVARFQELRSHLESSGKVEASSFQTLVSALAQKELSAAEGPDLERYQEQVQGWEAERAQLIQREREMREKAEQEKRERLAVSAAAQ
ncbi:28S ribosomal protein S27, mitochondrial [Periophthalmus magnuspinnatus]|uniref:28S ribosomal protein S27, mitochondrial n=1 Tax=Periophthalmus magnuspinnatus TaxID=409849 RepID=UPI0024368B1D|nr:28S ribosomal protein S27, mitochondrial [Periophthalmus magnuspinnatus]